MLGTIYSLARRIKRSDSFKPFRTLVNSMYYDPRMVTIKIENFDIIQVDGFKFHVDDQIDSIQRVMYNPWFANVRSDDVVLDIGANIGAITIPLASAAKKVYAVEPLFIEELKRNIALNNLDNVEILECGIGKPSEEQHYEFSSKVGIAPTISFSELLEKTGKVDFIKIDGEGCEWDIKPEQLEGIREIRIEFHIRRSHYTRDKLAFGKWLVWLSDNKYRQIVARGDGTSPCVPFSECLILNATRSGSWEFAEG